MYPLFLLSHAILLAASILAQGSSTLPIVDLGYTLHQATIGVRDVFGCLYSSLHFRTLTLHDQSTENGVSYLNFSNIRYAAPPIGALRFAAPIRPAVNRTVQDGQTTSICSQALPGWITTAQEVTTGEPVTEYRNYTVKDIPPVDPRTSEDCLFLNVLASSAVYGRRRNSSGAAVLVWIHGGGFTAGWKEEFGVGQDFIALSAGNRDGGVIYVAINYRLGLFVSYITNILVCASLKTFIYYRAGSELYLTDTMPWLMPVFSTSVWHWSGCRTIFTFSAAIPTASLSWANQRVQAQSCTK